MASKAGTAPGFTLPVLVKAVVIDLDGTLLDTIGDLSSAANSMRSELGLAPLDPELIKTFVGKGIANLVSRTLTAGRGNLEQAALNAAVALFERHYALCLTETSRPYPGAENGLQALHAKGLRLGCITNKAARFTRPLLESAGLAGYFEMVLSGDSLPRKKPDPLPLLHAAQFFNVEPRELLLIGDSVNDVQAARAAGCPVFVVPYGYNEGQDIRTLDYDVLIEGLDEAAKFVENAITSM
jgi:phosphoglycolate phosphatase